MLDNNSSNQNQNRIQQKLHTAQLSVSTFADHVRSSSLHVAGYTGKTGVLEISVNTC